MLAVFTFGTCVTGRKHTIVSQDSFDFLQDVMKDYTTAKPVKDTANTKPEEDDEVEEEEEEEEEEES